MKKLFLLFVISLFCAKAQALVFEHHRTERKIMHGGNSMIKKEVEDIIDEVIKNFTPAPYQWAIPSGLTYVDICEKVVTDQYLRIVFEYTIQGFKVNGRDVWWILWALYNTSLEDAFADYNDTLTNLNDMVDNTTGLSEFVSVEALRKIIYEYANQPRIELID